MPLDPSTMLNYVSGTNLQLQITGNGWPQATVYVRFRWRNYNATPLPGGPTPNVFTNDSAYTASTSLPFTYTFTNPTGLTVGNRYDFDCTVAGGIAGFPLIGVIFLNDVTLTSGGGGALCLAKGTKILTPSGYCKIETLKKGDLVETESKYVPIERIYSSFYDKTNKLTAPYIIYRNAFSKNYPPNDVVVSGRHAIQLRPGVWELPEEAAKENKNVVQCKVGESIVYYHIELPDYANDNLIANGCVVESLNSGKKYVESYVWSEKELGYIRTLKSTTRKVTLTQ
jgi:hypothetical protein